MARSRARAARAPGRPRAGGDAVMVGVMEAYHRRRGGEREGQANEEDNQLRRWGRAGCTGPLEPFPALGYDAVMETIVRTVGDLDQSVRSALEQVVGHALGEGQRLVIQVLANEPPASTPTPA